MKEKQFFEYFHRLLILAPHTDDEFGCAGTIKKIGKNPEVEIRYVAISKCEASVPEGYPKDVLVKECRLCTGKLGIPPKNVDLWDFPVRYFPEHRQEILERFVTIAREYQPDLVFLPSSFDTHQDHSTVYAEGFRAFKQSTIFGYELPQNTITFVNSAFVILTDDEMQGKIDAMGAYESQTFRNYSREEFMRGLATVRGAQCGSHYAEAFEVIRLICK